MRMCEEVAPWPSDSKLDRRGECSPAKVAAREKNKVVLLTESKRETRQGELAPAHHCS